MILSQETIMDLVKQAGTDSSGKWMGIHNAELFAKLVIDAYNKKISDTSPTQNIQDLT